MKLDKLCLCLCLCCVSSASLPPCQPRSGTHRALRGQSPATQQQQQQPSWAFIGGGSTATHSGLTVNSQPLLAPWQPATAAAHNHNAATVAAAAAVANNLLWRPPPHVDQAAVSCPLVVTLSVAIAAACVIRS